MGAKHAKHLADTLEKAAHEMNDLRSSALGRYGLDEVSERCLQSLAAQPLGLSLNQLASELGFGWEQVANQVSALARQGFVEVERVDGSSHVLGRVRITEQGAQVIEQVRVAVNDAVVEAFAGHDDEGMAAADKTVSSMVSTLAGRKRAKESIALQEVVIIGRKMMLQ